MWRSLRDRDVAALATSRDSQPGTFGKNCRFAKCPYAAIIDSVAPDTKLWAGILAVHLFREEIAFSVDGQLE